MKTSTAAPACPIHQVELVPSVDPEWKGRLLVCPFAGCQTATVLQQRPVQPKLPGLDPGRQQRAIPILEADLQRQCVQWAGLNRYEVLQIGQRFHYVSCPSCQYRFRSLTCPACSEVFQPSLPTTNDPGAPDTFVLDRDDPAAAWSGIELKSGPAAPVRPEQAQLIACGYVSLAWNLEMFRAALERRKDG
jgi:hypothetical protein